MITCTSCGQVFPFMVRVNGKVRNLCHRTKCLDCLPFKHGGQVEYLERRKAQRRSCDLCGKSGFLRICMACRTKIRRYLLKQAAIEMLGGKCSACGWSGDQVGFDFHHLRAGKNFDIGNVTGKSWIVVRRELLKCELLCVLCHRLRHSSRSDPKFLAEVQAYQGRRNSLLGKLKR